MDGVPAAELVARLTAAGCISAPEEARALHAAASDSATLAAWVERREHGEPLAWITGRFDFCGRTLRIAPGVYVPRPHTEDLARRAAAWLPAAGRAVDLCTGTGAIAAHLRAGAPAATVLGADVDSRAARCARTNGVPVLVADLANAIAGDGTWDLVTAVAPYVPTGELRYLPADVRRHEPATALDGGPDGLALVERVVVAAGRLLRTDGRLVTELGGTQDGPVRRVLAANGFDEVQTWTDEDGDLRGLAARRAQRYAVRSR